jgi:hypothetical protein
MSLEAKGYYEQFGFIPLPDKPLELFLPIATLQKAYDSILFCQINRDKRLFLTTERTEFTEHQNY